MVYRCWVRSSTVAGGAFLTHAPPDGGGDRAEHEGRHDRQEAEHEHGRDDSGVVAPEADQRRGQAELDDADPARRDRDAAEDARQRPGSERLHDAHLGCRNLERPQRDQQDDEDRQAAGERGQREQMPAPLEHVDDVDSEALEAASTPRDRPTMEAASPRSLHAPPGHRSPRPCGCCRGRARAQRRRRPGSPRRRTPLSRAPPSPRRRSSTGRAPRSDTPGWRAGSRGSPASPTERRRSARSPSAATSRRTVAIPTAAPPGTTIESAVVAWVIISAGQKRRPGRSTSHGGAKVRMLTRGTATSAKVHSHDTLLHDPPDVAVVRDLRQEVGERGDDQDGAAEAEQHPLREPARHASAQPCRRERSARAAAEEDRIASMSQGRAEAAGLRVRGRDRRNRLRHDRRDGDRHRRVHGEETDAGGSRSSSR